RICCILSSCVSYPFDHFKCEYCLEVFVIHCRRGQRPKGLCTQCLEEELELFD
ncbi:unnamed protein product, partial [Coccothraustes coccothraustes]